MADAAPNDPDLAQDFTALMTHSIHMAGDLLQKFNTFYPFGTVVTPSGQLEHYNAYSGDDRPPIREILETLAGTFKPGIDEGRYRATALCMNVHCASQDNATEIDAIRVNLNHRSGSEVVFFVPYSRTSAGYTFERPFTRPS
jgi:hypothetical protein